MMFVLIIEYGIHYNSIIKLYHIIYIISTLDLFTSYYKQYLDIFCYHHTLCFHVRF